MSQSASLEFSALSALDHGDHVCALYDSPPQQLRAVSEYVRIGLDAGDRCVYIVDDRTADEVLAGLAAAGIDVGAARASHRLDLTTKRDSYLRDGQFDPDAMIALLAAMTDRALADGCRGLRVTGEMTWALGPDVGCDRLIEYEIKLNRFFPGARGQALCQYNRSRFAPGIVRDVLRTHPTAVIADFVCPNLYYEPPELIGLPDGDARRVDYMIDRLLQARRREIELARAVALGDEFLSIASHELKTPVNALQLALAVGRRRGEISDASFARLEAQATRLAALVDRLLDVSRVGEGRVELQPEPVDVAAAVRERVTAFSAAAEAAGSEVRVHGDSCVAFCDRFRLEQIVDNLLSNAIKYGQGRPIDVSVEASGADVVVRVADQGIGIPADAHEEIFKRFVRLQSTRTFGGFGLGLWIAQQMATRMGGRIAVQSAPGAGAAFALRLPLVAHAAEAVH